MPTTKGSGQTGGGPRLKNYRSRSALSTTLEVIRKTLADHGARRISFDYESGQPIAISFTLAFNGQQATFQLPARLASVEPLLIKTLQETGNSVPRGDALKEQVAKTAWANVRDWLIAQMTFLQTKMVEPEEIFLPYMLLEGYQKPITYYEAFKSYHALPSPEQRGHVTRVEEVV